ncbi:MAG: hypothetical protein ISP60_04460 [Flavobacteriaceae bacterium]|nr:hypothetical protein [Flavobacteriaceae bacterium]
MKKLVAFIFICTIQINMSQTSNKVTAQIIGLSSNADFENIFIKTTTECKCEDYNFETGLELERLTFNNIQINNSEYYKLKEDVKAVVLNKIIEIQDNPNRIFANVKMEVELEKNGKIKKKTVSVKGDKNISNLNFIYFNPFFHFNNKLKSFKFVIDNKTNFRANYEVLIPVLSKKMEFIVNRKIQSKFGSVEYGFKL